MALRLGACLRNSPDQVRAAEVRDVARAAVKAALGTDCYFPEAALAGGDVAVLAVPVNLIGQVMTSIDPLLKAGMMLVSLDAAALYAGHLPERPDLTHFITHPCHPPIFNDETDMAAKKNYFGGIAAKQHIVSALIEEPESDYAKGEALPARFGLL